MVVVFLSLFVLPVGAVGFAGGGSFNGQDNLIQYPTSSNISTVNVVMSNGSVIEAAPFFDVALNPNTDYTFISIGGGSDRVLIAPKVNVNGEYSNVYTYNSSNYLILGNETQVINGITFTSNRDGSLTLNGTSGNTATVFYLTNYYIPSGTYYYKVFGDRPLNGSNFYSGFTNQDTGVSGGDYGSGSRFTSNGNRYTFAFTVGPNFTLNNVKIYPGVYDSMPSEWTPGYSAVSFVNDNVSLLTFRTPSLLSGQYVIGIKDSTLDSSFDDAYFTRYKTENNQFYLIEGVYTYQDAYDFIYDEIGSIRYNAGYNEGYRIGETNGLNSNHFFRNLIYTIFCAPFIFLTNAFNFEIFGVNLYHIITIMITLMLVSFVIKIFKKGF